MSLPDINMNEHFVSLGGDSLIATELMAHLSATFGVNLSLLLPFEADTLQDLVAQIDILRRSYDDGAMEDERDEVSNLR
jgi:acyl carrier protein